MWRMLDPAYTAYGLATSARTRPSLGRTVELQSLAPEVVGRGAVSRTTPKGKRAPPVSRSLRTRGFGHSTGGHLVAPIRGSKSGSEPGGTTEGSGAVRNRVRDGRSTCEHTPPRG